MSNKTEHNKKALLEALKKSLGVVTTACDECEIGRTTYYEYYNNDKDFKAKVDDLCEEALDFAESKLFSRIKGYEHSEDKIFNDGGKPLIVPTIKHYPPDPTSIIFYLKTKGKNRGYIEKQVIEQTVTDKAALLKELPPKERAKRIKELVKELKL